MRIIRYINSNLGSSKHILMLITLLWVGNLSAQNFSSMSVDKDTAFIGDPIFINLKIVKQSNITRIDLSPLSNMTALHDTSQVDVSIESYGEWSVDENGIVDLKSIKWSTNAKGKQKAFTQIKAIFWDNGQYKLPQIRLPNSMPIESPIITIYAPQDVYKTAGDSTMAIMPIKSILKENKKFMDYLPTVFGLLCLLILGGVFYYLKSKKTRELMPELIVPQRLAHELAYEQLNKLSKKQLWQNGEIKQYQSELTHIIREYLGKRFQINALENTTEKIINDLKKTDFDDNLHTNVSNILQMADMIKFAKARPSDDIHQQFWNQAKELIDKTKIIPKQEDLQ